MYAEITLYCYTRLSVSVVKEIFDNIDMCSLRDIYGRNSLLLFRLFRPVLSSE